MEKRDLYDENKQPTGETIFKGETIPNGRYYITVVIFIQNEEGKFLIQKRTFEKNGKWATTGGHPVSGESSLQGIITEIKEELGIEVESSNIQLFKTIKTNDDFVDLYYLKENVNIDNVTLQKEEVNQVKWASVEDINKMIHNGDFSESHTAFFKMCLDFLSNK